MTPDPWIVLIAATFARRIHSTVCAAHHARRLHDVRRVAGRGGPGDQWRRVLRRRRKIFASYVDEARRRARAPACVS